MLVKSLLQKAPGTTLALKDLGGTLLVETDSIIRIEAINNYSALFLADGRKITVSRVLKQFEDVLHNYGFARIHRSHLVNRSWVLHYNAGNGQLKMRNNETVMVARRRKRTVKEKIIQSCI